jgi:hypothetical protein
MRWKFRPDKGGKEIAGVADLVVGARVRPVLRQCRRKDDLIVEIGLVEYATALRSKTPSR